MFEKIFIVIGVVLLAAVSMAAVFELSGNKMEQKDTVTILRGQNAVQIANELKAEGYIDSKIVFLYEVLKSGNWKNLKAGEYDFKGGGIAEIIDKLVNAKTAAKILAIIPGWTINDIAKFIQAEKLFGDENFKNAISGKNITELKGEFEILTTLPAGADLEGYLFPDTYQIAKETSAQDLTRAILKNFEKKYSAISRANSQSRNIHEIIIMASMLEKEVISLEDKKIVAGILYKRLQAKMPLQVDSTLLYSKSGNLKAINKEIDSPYNTYKYAGMPAGPICNPGIESIEAAIEPIETPHWYYLSAPDGATIFAKTYNEHLQNIAQHLTE